MFGAVDAASAKSVVSPPLPTNNKLSSSRKEKELYNDADTPDMDDIKNAIKVIGVIKRLINKNHLVIKPEMNNGLVEKGIVPVEASRKFTSRVGAKARKSSLKKKTDEDETNEDDDEEEPTKMKNSKTKNVAGKSKKIVVKVSG